MNFHELHTFVLNSFGFFVCWRHCVLCSLHLVTFLKFLPDWIRGYIKSSLTFFWTINWSFPKAFQTLQCPLVLDSGICLPSCRSRSEEEMKRLRETYPSQPNMQARWLENIMISFLDSIAAWTFWSQHLPGRWPRCSPPPGSPRCSARTDSQNSWSSATPLAGSFFFGSTFSLFFWLIFFHPFAGSEEKYIWHFDFTDSSLLSETSWSVLTATITQTMGGKLSHGFGKEHKQSLAAISSQKSK